MKLVTRMVEQIDHIATGAAAKIARIKSGKTQAEIGEIMGLHNSYIHMLERGRANWSEALLKRFKKAL